VQFDHRIRSYSFTSYGRHINRVIVASLGASFVHCVYHAARAYVEAAVPYRGYVIGIFSAWICSSLSFLLVGNQQFIAFHISCHIFFGALAVGLSVFLMVVTNSEHPPAAALALGLVMDGCPPVSIVVSLTGIITLCLIKAALKRYMINLL
jgi:CBS-domain-containing membrane protein